MKSKEELVTDFREAFNNLPKEYKKKEVERAWAIVQGKKFIVLEDSDEGKVLKFLHMADFREYVKRYKDIKSDRSYIYKILNGQGSGYFHGYKIYYEEIK
jgi:hypothetical protein